MDASQQVLIETLPPILVLHMKRFLYDTKVNGVVKIGKQVSFGPELEIQPDIIAPARRTSQSTKYKLFGGRCIQFWHPGCSSAHLYLPVLYHHGVSASGGHYTLDVLHHNHDLSSRPRESWMRIDDELVSDVKAEDVFGGVDRDDRCAYLLFYQRISGPIVASRT
jgi:ubiquitin carboxyl-terminal hydrolase 10